jgi:ankyrin repeat protein
MSDPFELVSKGDVAGLKAALALDPSLIRVRHPQGASLVSWAAYMGNPEAIGAIRAIPASLDPYEAIILGDEESLERALASGWDGNALSPDGFTPLGLAAFFDNLEAFELLLPLTRDVSQPAENGQKVAALHAATAKRNIAMVDKLLRAGANPNQVQADGFTPLHAAAMHGDCAIAGMLLLAGADASARNAKGEDASTLARRAGHEWLANRLGEA